MDATPANDQATGTDLNPDPNLSPMLHGMLMDLVKVNLHVVQYLARFDEKLDFVISLLTREESRKAEKAASMAGDYN